MLAEAASTIPPFASAGPSEPGVQRCASCSATQSDLRAMDKQGAFFPGQLWHRYDECTYCYWCAKTLAWAVILDRKSVV